MSKQPRIASAIPGQEANFGAVLAHLPETARKFADLYAEFWSNGVADVRIKEMTRIRNARVTDCGYWRQVRFDSARAAGLQEEKVAQITEGYAAALPPAEAAALALTDALIGVPHPPDEAAQQALKAHYSDPEIAEIALGVGLFLGMSKVLINLGLEPEDMPVTVLPTPRNLRAKAAP